MTARYVLAPEAALDLVRIWRYLKKQSSVAIADRVESVMRGKIFSWQERREPDTGTRI